MSSPATASTARRRVSWSAGRVAPALGVGVVWLFLLVFLVYPLLRILYDAFSDEAGRLTLANFVEFVARPLLSALALEFAAARVWAPWWRPRSLGFAVAFLLVRYDFVGRNALQLL